MLDGFQEKGVQVTTEPCVPAKESVPEATKLKPKAVADLAVAVLAVLRVTDPAIWMLPVIGFA